MTKEAGSQENLTLFQRAILEGDVELEPSDFEAMAGFSEARDEPTPGESSEDPFDPTKYTFPFEDITGQGKAGHRAYGVSMTRQLSSVLREQGH